MQRPVQRGVLHGAVLGVGECPIGSDTGSGQAVPPGEDYGYGLCDRRSM